MNIKYIYKKELLKEQIKALHRRGGHYQKAAIKINSIIGSINMGEAQPFKGVPLTNHGESRIKHCIKYDLNGACRLITIQDNNVCALVFAGDHDACDKWLNINRNYTLTISADYEITGIRITEDLSKLEQPRIVEEIITDGSLISKLKDKYLEVIEDNVKFSNFKKISALDSFSDEEEILDALVGIADSKVQDMIFDVLLYIKGDDVDNAKDRILIFSEEIKKVSDALPRDLEKVTSGEEFLSMDDFIGRDFKKIIEGNNWLDWMLFMHPQQKKVVDEDFSGPARLLGVSGSGKTCVVVNRAIRLSRKYKNEKILITTINRSLADLIEDLIEKALESENDKEELAKQIEVKSFWQICRDLILENSKEAQNDKLLSDVTFKTDEDVDQIWREFYQCRENNDDAKILLDVHGSLLSRNIFPSQYLKQEFDYVRSSLRKDERNDYLKMEREGRSEAFPENFRSFILQGLEKWEEKMRFVGVSDYLGLLEPLHQYVTNIHPKYRCILVDELQDFGTTELEVLRKLVEPADNDLFLCGDIAQQVLTKQHKIVKAGIKPVKYLSITKNYRNSRQILEAASDVFKKNTDEIQYNQNGFQLLNPEYANFSTPKPFIRKSTDLNAEIQNSYSYLNENLESQQKACLVVAGLTYFQVKYLGKKMKLPVLDGDHDLSSSNIFLSDLEQTKGFEFDIVIIVNCSKNEFPNSKLPQSEKFREISKLYVSMTRAKKELIISYNDHLSEVFETSLEFFNSDTNWQEYIDESKAKEIEIPETETVFDNNPSYKLLNGRELLYQPIAVGLSLSAQQKIVDSIQGKSSSATNGSPDGWKTVGEFKESLFSTRLFPHMSRLLGPKVVEEIREKLPR
ncbi:MULTISPECIES: UvrD-helicase domain-containing protein [unclassified Arenibacter]|uniref:UvrD-helicase domain-containing protein n=1 Tax=unclassified Arenibacter TaxID=2615047 RepID=UPI000E355516|nr:MULTISPECIES: UvrD-helicase domain-containing protein [unclassified Arenibacter]MCM4162999.1 helicase [Arenibacter sp. A80]RFT57038.1 helicase [Arenibacter sp. P308M17]